MTNKTNLLLIGFSSIVLLLHSLVEGDESGKWGQKAAFLKASFVSVGIKDYKCYGSVLLPHTHHSSTNIFQCSLLNPSTILFHPLAHKHLLWLVMCLICFFLYTADDNKLNDLAFIFLFIHMFHIDSWFLLYFFEGWAKYQT